MYIIAKLLDQLRRAVRVRNYSIRTERSYVDWTYRYIVFHGKRHPAEMGATEITAFLSYLATDPNVAASTQNQACCAIIFLYKHVLEKDLAEFGPIVRAKKPKRLPVVLSAEETASVLSGLNGLHRLMGELLYGTGMRIIELIRLRVKDVRTTMIYTHVMEDGICGIASPLARVRMIQRQRQATQDEPRPVAVQPTTERNPTPCASDHAGNTASERATLVAHAQQVKARVAQWRPAALLRRIGYAALWAFAFLSAGDKQP